MATTLFDISILPPKGGDKRAIMSVIPRGRMAKKGKRLPDSEGFECIKVRRIFET